MLHSASDYKVYYDDILGRGYFGFTYTAVHEPSGLTRAVKMVKRSYFERQCQREIDVLKKVGGYPNIVELLDVVDDAQQTDIWIVMERCWGNLNKYLSKIWWLSNDELKHIFRQIAKGLEAIYANGIIHRDLKPENILLQCATEADKPDLRTAVVKLADFNVSAILTDEGKVTTSTARGSFAYQAPERLGTQKKEYGPEVDIWSAGVVLYECSSKFGGTKPARLFDADEEDDVRELHKNFTRPNFGLFFKLRRPKDLRDLIEQMLRKKIAEHAAGSGRQRITAVEFLKHPFLN